MCNKETITLKQNIMTTKLANKLAKQNKATELAMGSYTVGSKTTRSRNSGFYKPTFVNRIKI